ncbi:ABC transporter permease [Pradoshia sp.]
MISMLVNEHYRLARNRFVQLSLLIIPVITSIMAIFFSDILKNNDGNMLNYMSIVSSTLIVISFLGIGVAGTILSNEYQYGTLKLIMIRPISRSALLFSKWLTVICYLLYLFILMFIVSMAVGSLLFGFEGFGANGHMFGNIMLNYVIGFTEAFMIVTFTYMVSVVFKNGAFSIGVGMAAFLGGKLATEIFRLLEWKSGIFLLFANTKLDQYFFGNQPIYDEMSLLYSMTILGLHFCFFYGVAWWFFVKRDISV